MFPDFLNQLKGNNIVALMNCHICCCLLFLFFFLVYMGLKFGQFCLQNHPSFISLTLTLRP